MGLLDDTMGSVLEEDMLLVYCLRSLDSESQARVMLSAALCTADEPQVHEARLISKAEEKHNEFGSQVGTR